MQSDSEGMSPERNPRAEAQEHSMSLTAYITTNDTDILGRRILAVGNSQVLVGDHIGTFADDAGDTGYPVVLVNGDPIIDDQDRDELRALLNELGFDFETDDEGIVLVIAQI